MGMDGLVLSGTEHGPVTGFFEHGDEPLKAENLTSRGTVIS
jgi:hypothetical protein